MSLVLASKTHMKWLKNCKNRTMLEKRKHTSFTVQGLISREWIIILHKENVKKLSYFSMVTYEIRNGEIPNGFNIWEFSIVDQSRAQFKNPSNHFGSLISFYTPLTRSGHVWFFDVFRNHKMRPVMWNGLTGNHYWSSLI